MSFSAYFRRSSAVDFKSKVNFLFFDVLCIAQISSLVVTPFAFVLVPFVEVGALRKPSREHSDWFCQLCNKNSKIHGTLSENYAFSRKGLESELSELSETTASRASCIIRPEDASTMIWQLETFGLWAAGQLHDDSSLDWTSKNVLWILQQVHINRGMRNSLTHRFDSSTLSNSVDFPRANAKFIARTSNRTDLSVVFFVLGGSVVQPFQDPSFSHNISLSDKLMRQTPRKHVLVSNVIGVSVSSGNQTALPRPVSLVLGHSAEVVGGSIHCVFWDLSAHRWSDLGCQALQSNATHTTCQCHHLSTFALIMTTEDYNSSTINSTAPIVTSYHLSSFALIMATEDYDSSAIKSTAQIVTSYVFSILSILCLVLTVVTFVKFKHLRTDKVVIQFNMFTLMIAGQLLFIVGIHLTGNPQLCRGIAIALHFIFLSMFSWMVVEGCVVAAKLLFPTKTKGRIPAFLPVAAYAISVMYVLATVYRKLDDYGTRDYCWLNVKNGAGWNFVGPALSGIVFNIVPLIVAIYTMCKHSRTSEKYTSRSFLGRLKLWARGIFSMLFVLGIPYVVGIFQTVHECFSYIFLIVSGGQGIFIFLFHCATISRVRLEYLRIFSAWVIKNQSFLPKAVIDYFKRRQSKAKCANALRGGRNLRVRKDSLAELLNIFRPGDDSDSLHLTESIVPTFANTMTKALGAWFVASPAASIDNIDEGGCYGHPVDVVNIISLPSKKYSTYIAERMSGMLHKSSVSKKKSSVKKTGSNTSGVVKRTASTSRGETSHRVDDDVSVVRKVSRKVSRRVANMLSWESHPVDVRKDSVEPPPPPWRRSLQPNADSITPNRRAENDNRVTKTRCFPCCFLVSQQVVLQREQVQEVQPEPQRDTPLYPVDIYDFKVCDDSRKGQILSAAKYSSAEGSVDTGRIKKGRNVLENYDPALVYSLFNKSFTSLIDPQETVDQVPSVSELYRKVSAVVYRKTSTNEAQEEHSSIELQESAICYRTPSFENLGRILSSFMIPGVASLSQSQLVTSKSDDDSKTVTDTSAEKNFTVVIHYPDYVDDVDMVVPRSAKSVCVDTGGISGHETKDGTQKPSPTKKRSQGPSITLTSVADEPPEETSPELVPEETSPGTAL